MSKTKDLLQARQKELKKQLAELSPLQEELKDIEKALKALEPKEVKKSCTGCGNGCDICRSGPYYR